jgi:hypothetical protein
MLNSNDLRNLKIAATKSKHDYDTPSYKGGMLLLRGGAPRNNSNKVCRVARHIARNPTYRNFYQWNRTSNLDLRFKIQNSKFKVKGEVEYAFALNPSTRSG